MSAGIPKRLAYKPRTPSQPSGIFCCRGPFFITFATSAIMVQFNADVVAAAAAALNFTQVALTPPLDWIAGGSLFPSQIIAGYNAPLDEYTAEEWSAHILDACKGYEACTSADGFQATNSGSTGGRFWFGYVYRGGATDESFYVRSEGVTDAFAYTIVE